MVQFLGLLPAVHGDSARVCGRLTSQVQFLGLLPAGPWDCTPFQPLGCCPLGLSSPTEWPKRVVTRPLSRTDIIRPRLRSRSFQASVAPSRVRVHARRDRRTGPRPVHKVCGLAPLKAFKRHPTHQKVWSPVLPCDFAGSGVSATPHRLRPGAPSTIHSCNRESV